MKSKKKLIIALSSLCFVVVAAVVTVSVVLAAINQTVNTNIKVSYTAKEVAATVSAQYTWGGATTDMTTDGTAEGEKTISFDGSETTETPKSLHPQVQEIVLENAEGKKSVTFTYTFTNDGDATFYATVEFASTANENVTVDYNGKTAPETVTVVKGTPVTYTITVSIDNVALNASFAGAFNWALTTTAPGTGA